jgi:hypothetical protein
MKELHVFRCGVQDLYAVTQDRTGANLPGDLCTSRWLLMKSLRYEAHLPPWGLDITAQEKQGALLAGLQQNGFFISEGGALPAALITPDPV